MDCPSIKRSIAGREFELKMDFFALMTADKLTGRNFLDADVWKDLNVMAVTALFFACASRTDASLSINDVRGLHHSYAAPLVEACRAAWKASSEVTEEEPRPTDGSEQKVSSASGQ